MTINLTLLVCLVALYFPTLILCACWRAHKADDLSNQACQVRAVQR